MSSTKNDELMAFSPALMAKWEAAADKASRDFRSDVVTVPTPDMMQVWQIFCIYDICIEFYGIVGLT